MKEASGELNMTLVTIIAIAAILGVFTFLLPTIRNTINKRWNDNAGQTVDGATAGGMVMPFYYK